LHLACSDSPLPVTLPVATEISEVAGQTATQAAYPVTEAAYPVEQNTTFLPAVESSGTNEVIVDDAVEEPIAAYPVPTPEPVSPRPEVTLEAQTEATEAQVQPSASGETTYTIQRGDILGFIARDFGISVTELMQANGITDPNRIEAGQILVIPVEEIVSDGREDEAASETALADAVATETADEPEAQAVDSGATVEPANTDEEVVQEPSADDAVSVADEEVVTEVQRYVVKPGDSLGNIAKQFGIPLGVLAAANGLSVTSFVYVDQVLIISADSTPAEPAQTYIIQRGDTLRIIAERFGVTINALAAANGIANPNTIYVGQALVIPNQP
jgi:LysM repeat protein